MIMQVIKDFDLFKCSGGCWCDLREFAANSSKCQEQLEQVEQTGGACKYFRVVRLNCSTTLFAM